MTTQTTPQGGVAIEPVVYPLTEVLKRFDKEMDSSEKELIDDILKEQKPEANNQKCRSLHQVDTARKGANEKSIRGSRNEHISVRLE